MSGIAAKKDETGEEEGRGCGGKEEDGVPVGGLHGGRRGARGVQALRAALRVGIQGHERQKNRCQQKQMVDVSRFSSM